MHARGRRRGNVHKNKHFFLFCFETNKNTHRFVEHVFLLDRNLVFYSEFFARRWTDEFFLETFHQTSSTSDASVKSSNSLSGMLLSVAAIDDVAVATVDAATAVVVVVVVVVAVVVVDVVAVVIVVDVEAEVVESDNVHTPLSSSLSSASSLLSTNKERTTLLVEEFETNIT